ncbi:hypothetical protein Y032_0026g1304 [Ancylostoma ceylanicum]|uniref:Uncharacterized protein n=1 Tax=Ancylostoma ceylanicum TaxID=53326 RepID=A0A016UUN0_9BILA|nr:hypothetical protein Y032_0026g1304 [Ancylostoma ceylanicum]
MGCITSTDIEWYGSILEAVVILQRITSLCLWACNPIWKVHDQKDPTKLFAMKVEKKLETRKHSKLKMEARHICCSICDS